jgi:hypothetical protein
MKAGRQNRNQKTKRWQGTNTSVLIIPASGLNSPLKGNKGTACILQSILQRERERNAKKITVSLFCYKGTSKIRLIQVLLKDGQVHSQNQNSNNKVSKSNRKKRKLQTILKS